jgi:hypothetical protein
MFAAKLAGAAKTAFSGAARAFTPYLIRDPARAKALAGNHPFDRQPLFEAHPYYGVAVYSKGRELTGPFRSQEDMTILHSTVDLAEANRRLGGTGLYPVTMEGPDGHPVALAQLRYLDYTDSSLAPPGPAARFKDLGAVLLVTDKPMKPLPCKNDFSVLTGAAIPGVKYFYLGLEGTNPDCIDVGREILTLDKRLAQIDDTSSELDLFGHTAVGQQRVQVSTPDGKPSIALDVPMSGLKMIAESGQVRDAFGGLPLRELKAAAAKAMHLDVVNRNVNGGGELARWTIDAQVDPEKRLMHRVSPSVLRVWNNTELGRTLNALKIQPRVMTHDVGALSSMDAPLPEKK